MNSSSGFLPRLRRAASFLGPRRAAVAGVVALALTLAALNAFEPLLLKHIFDALGGDDDARAALRGVLGLVVLGVARESLGALSNWLMWRARIGVHYALMEATVERLHRLPLSFHKASGVGAVMTKLERGVQGFVGAVSELAFSLVPAAAYLTFAVVMMFRLDATLGLVTVAFAPLPVLIARRIAPHQVARERALLDRWTHIYSRFNEVLSGIVTVKSFAMEEREKQRFLHEVRAANEVVTRGVGLDSSVSAAQNAVALFARVAALGVGAGLVAQGDIGVGTLVAFLGFIGGMFAPISSLSGLYRTLRTASVSMDEVYSVLDHQDLLGDAPDAREVGRLRGDVSFEDIHFTYAPVRERPLIDGVTLHIRAGERVALVGPSGAGKSTLMALLCRFYDPQRGVVRVDGTDIRELKQASLRRQVGVVFQDSLLFNESVAANIAYGRPEATPAEIEAAAQAAHAHEFITRLPHGYQTLVGERGSRLSAGERQRIAIARSLLKDPAILILDEPTSALDAESEALVQDALDRLTQGRTTLSIAHRLSTVVAADRIVVLKEGRIAEEGTHQALMRHRGYYRSLVDLQTRGLLVEDVAEPTPTANLS